EAEDKARKEAIETKNEADALAFRAQKSLTEFKDKLPANVVSEIQTRIDAVKKALEGEDTAAIKAASDELQAQMQRIGEELSKAGAAAGAQPGGAKPTGDTVEEAEVEIVDDEKK